MKTKNINRYSIEDADHSLECKDHKQCPLTGAFLSKTYYLPIVVLGQIKSGKFKVLAFDQAKGIKRIMNVKPHRVKELERQA